MKYEFGHDNAHDIPNDSTKFVQTIENIPIKCTQCIKQ